jgi:hypothetical protein
MVFPSRVPLMMRLRFSMTACYYIQKIKIMWQIYFFLYCSILYQWHTTWNTDTQHLKGLANNQLIVRLKRHDATRHKRANAVQALRTYFLIFWASETLSLKNWLPALNMPTRLSLDSIAHSKRMLAEFSAERSEITHLKDILCLK